MHVFACIFLFLSNLYFYTTVFFQDAFTVITQVFISKTNPNIGKSDFSVSASTIWN